MNGSASNTIDTCVTAEILAGSGVSLGQAAEWFPAYHGGKKSTKVNPSTIWRWITAGVRLRTGLRLRLEAARLGGRWLTSAAAIERFIRARTPVLETATAPATKPRDRRAQQAMDKRAKAGS